MFKRQCDSRLPHPRHVYEKHWVKKDLPNLLHPETYPLEWDAPYQCDGIEAPLALSVEYLHTDCTPCEACADMAADRLYARHTDGEVWRELGPGDVVAHMAEVRRL